jgi:hypothetical protein
MTFRRAARGMKSLYREVNERIEHLKSGWLPLTELNPVCECWDDGCFVPLTLTRDEYLAVRVEAAHFVVAPDHVDLLIERVVSKHPAYWVVAKIEKAIDVAVALAARGNAEAA